jgi:2'-5' RNA ligase
VDHVVVPLDDDHVVAVRALVRDLAATLGLDEDQVTSQPPHITLAGFNGADRPEVEARVAAIAAATPPFPVRAHGLGVFAGDTERSLALFVPVVRDPRLSRLHRRVCRSLRAQGATVGGQHAADVWTPHVTLLDRCLNPERLAAAVERLARRTHPSWNIPIACLGILGPGRGPSTPALTFPFPPAAGAGPGGRGGGGRRRAAR